MRERAGLVPEISLNGLEILPWTSEWILAVRLASSSIACCIFHIMSIPFNCSDTALSVTEAMIDPKVNFFCISPCLLCFSNIAPELFPRIFGLSHLGISYEPKAKRASPVNRAHVKRPWDWTKCTRCENYFGFRKTNVDGKTDHSVSLR